MLFVLAFAAAPASAATGEYRSCVGLLNSALEVGGSIEAAIATHRQALGKINYTTPTAPKVASQDALQAFSDAASDGLDAYTAALADFCETLR